MRYSPFTRKFLAIARASKSLRLRGRPVLSCFGKRRIKDQRVTCGPRRAEWGIASGPNPSGCSVTSVFDRIIGGIDLTAA